MARFMRQIEDYILDNASEEDLVAIEKFVKIKRDRLKKGSAESRIAAALSGKFQKMIREVVAGFIENELAPVGASKKEVLDVLSDQMGNEAWGEDVKEEFFYGAPEFRKELEAALLKKHSARKASFVGMVGRVADGANLL
jgi:hypothetical protein